MTTAQPPSTSASPTARQLWRTARGPLVAAAVLVLAGLVLAGIRSGDRNGQLDPRSATPQGSRAAAQLLSARGVKTSVVSSTAEATAAAGPDTTLLVVHPELLTDRQRQVLRQAMEHRGGRTVLLAPDPQTVAALTSEVRVSEPAAVAPRPADCALPAASRAGAVDLGGFRYATSAPGSEGCYPSDGLPTLVRLPAGEGDTVLMGSPDLLYNDRLAQQGNASLALQLLGSRPHLVWYLPSLDDPSAAEGQRGVAELIPPGWYWGAVQLGIAAVLAAVWRSRRLGPLVTERLPVTVRAAEATEGRARLYRQANARDRAADALRTATRRRLAPLVGVATAHAHHPETLSAAVAARGADDAASVTALLFGPPPSDDAALIQLADDLDRLEHRLTPLRTDKDQTS